MKTYDRNDYRGMEDKLLLEEARYAPCAELAIVLAERMQDMQRERPEVKCPNCDYWFSA